MSDKELINQLKGMLNNIPKIPFMHVFCHPSDKEKMEKTCSPANKMMVTFSIPLDVPSEKVCLIFGIEPGKPWTIDNELIAIRFQALIKKAEEHLDDSIELALIQEWAQQLMQR